MTIENKTIGKIVIFVWFVLFPAISFYLFPDACLFAIFLIFVLVGIPLLMEIFGYQGEKSQNRNDRSSQESWGSGWSDSWGSGDYGGGWDGGGDCGGGDGGGGGDCGGE